MTTHPAFCFSVKVPSEIMSIDVSLDETTNSANTVATGHGDGVVRLWDAQTAQLLFELNGHRKSVRSVKLSSTAGQVLSCGDDHAVMLWDCATGIMLQEFSGHSEAVYSAIFAKNNSMVISVSSDRTVRIWDVSTGNLLQCRRGHMDSVLCVALFETIAKPANTSRNSRNNQQLQQQQQQQQPLHTIVTGSLDRSIRLWGLEDVGGKSKHILAGHTEAVNALAISPDRSHIASGSLDKSIRIWDSTSGVPLLTLRCTDNILSLSFSLDAHGQFLLCSGEGGNVWMWNPYTAEFISQFSGHSQKVRGAVFANTKCTRAITGGTDCYLRFWNLQVGLDETGFRRFDFETNATMMQISSDGSRMATAHPSGKAVYLFDAVSEKKLSSLIGYSGDIVCMSLSSCGRFVAASGRHKKIAIWDLGSSQGNGSGSSSSSSNQNSMIPIIKPFDALLDGHPEAVLFLSFSSDGRMLVSCGNDKTMRIWSRIDTENKSSSSSSSSKNSANNLELIPPFTSSPSFRARPTPSISKWDSTSFLEFTGHAAPVSHAYFFSGDKRLVSASIDLTIRIWDVASQMELQQIIGHLSTIKDICLFPGSEFEGTGSSHVLASVSPGDRTVRIWDLGTGEELRRLTDIEEKMNCVTVSPNGTMVVATSVEDRCARIWYLKAGFGALSAATSLAGSSSSGGDDTPPTFEEREKRKKAELSRTLARVVENLKESKRTLGVDVKGWSIPIFFPEPVRSARFFHNTDIPPIFCDLGRDGFKNFGSGSSSSATTVGIEEQQQVNGEASSNTKHNPPGSNHNNNNNNNNASTGNTTHPSANVNNEFFKLAVIIGKSQAGIWSGLDDLGRSGLPNRKVVLPKWYLRMMLDQGKYDELVDSMQRAPGSMYISEMLSPGLLVRLAFKGKAEALRCMFDPLSYVTEEDVELAKKKKKTALMNYLPCIRRGFVKLAPVIRAVVDSENLNRADMLSAILEGVSALIKGGTTTATTEFDGTLDDDVCLALSSALATPALVPSIQSFFLRTPLLQAPLCVSHGFRREYGFKFREDFISFPSKATIVPCFWEQALESKNDDSDDDDDDEEDESENSKIPCECLVLPFSNMAQRYLFRALVNTGKAEFFQTLPVRALLEFKWHAYGRWKYTRQFLLYLCGLVSMVAMSLTVSGHSEESLDERVEDISNPRQIVTLFSILGVLIWLPLAFRHELVQWIKESAPPPSASAMQIANETETQKNEQNTRSAAAAAAAVIPSPSSAAIYPSRERQDSSRSNGSVSNNNNNNNNGSDDGGMRDETEALLPPSSRQSSSSQNGGYGNGTFATLPPFPENSSIDENGNGSNGGNGIGTEMAAMIAAGGGTAQRRSAVFMSKPQRRSSTVTRRESMVLGHLREAEVYDPSVSEDDDDDDYQNPLTPAMKGRRNSLMAGMPGVIPPPLTQTVKPKKLMKKIMDNILSLLDFLEFWNILDQLHLWLSALAVGLTLAGVPACELVIAITVYLRWFGILYYLQAFSATASLIRMILQILNDMKWVLMVLAIAVLAAANAFYVMIQYEDAAAANFGTPGLALFTMFNAVIMGSFDINTMVVGYYDVYLRFIFVITMVLVSIVLLNLLIALMGDSYMVIQRRSMMELNLLRAGVIVEQELFMSDEEFAREDWFPNQLQILVRKGKNTVVDADADESQAKFILLEKKIKKAKAKLRDRQELMRKEVAGEIMRQNLELERQFSYLATSLGKEPLPFLSSQRKVAPLKKLKAGVNAVRMLNRMPMLTAGGGGSKMSGLLAKLKNAEKENSAVDEGEEGEEKKVTKEETAPAAAQQPETPVDPQTKKQLGALARAMQRRYAAKKLESSNNNAAAAALPFPPLSVQQIAAEGSVVEHRGERRVEDSNDNSSGNNNASQVMEALSPVSIVDLKSFGVC